MGEKQKSERSSEKNFKKLLKNLLTNGKESGIINRLSQRNGTEWHGGTPDRLKKRKARH